MKKNKFSKALKHIKKDLKEVAPTNSMSGVYSLNDPGFSLQQVSAPKRFLPDVDGNFPSGIPGNAGDSSYTRPAGIWTGEVDWDTVTQPNFGNSRVGDDGTNTATLIDEATGTVLTALPPNSRSFILGPLVDGFVYNHLSDAYTKIGYIQKDTRQFVLLAQIAGTWSANWPTDSTGNYSGTNFNVWNGTSTGFTAYNSSFTLAMAQWMRTEILAGRFMKNVSYFQSGGVSQPQLPAGGGLPSGMYGGGGVGAGAGDAAGDGGIGDGYGSGGDPDIGDQQTAAAKKGDSGDAELWGLTKKQQEDAEKYGISNERWSEMTEDERQDFMDKQDALQADIDKYSQQQKDAEAEARRIAIEFGIDVALTIFGGAIIKGIGKGISLGVKGLRASQRAKAISNAAKLIKATDKVDDAAAVVKATQAYDKAKAAADAAKAASKATKAAQQAIRTSKPGSQYSPFPKGYKGPTKTGPLTGKTVSGKTIKQIPKGQPGSSTSPYPKGYKGPQTTGKLTGKSVPKSTVPKSSPQSASIKNGPLSKSQTPKKGPGGKYKESDLNILDKNNNAIAKNVKNSKTGKWERINKPGSDASASDLAKWERLEGQVSKKAWQNYVKTGELNPGAIGNPLRAMNPFVKGGLRSGPTALAKKYGIPAGIGGGIGGAVIGNEIRKGIEGLSSSEQVQQFTSNIKSTIETTISKASSPEQATNSTIQLVSQVLPQDIRTPARMFLGYLSGSIKGNAGDIVPEGDQESAWEGMKINKDGGITVGGPMVNVFGGEPADSLTVDGDNAVFKFNFAPRSNEEEFAGAPKGRWSPGYKDILTKLQPLTQYAADLSPNFGATLKDKAIGLAAGASTNVFKQIDKITPDGSKLGGIKTARDLNGSIKIPMSKLKSLNSSAYKYLKSKNVKESYELTESRRRQLREIKKPYVVQEQPVQKLKKYRPNFKGNLSPQNTPDKTASKESDALVMSGNQKGQAWRTADKYWSGYETQERMNVISDRVGHGQMAWDMIIDEARKKNGWKNREIQEQLNQIAHDKAMRDLHSSYESPFGYVIHEQGASTEEELDTVMKDPAVKVKHPSVKNLAKRLKGQIDYEDKPSRKGFPDEPPAKQIDGWHPEYGKKYKYDKLDPVSAVAMRNAPTGDPEIDANVEKAARKPKVKVKEEISDWRSETDILEQMTTTDVFSYMLDGSYEDLHTMQTGFDGEAFTGVTNFTDIALVNDPHGMGTNIRNNADPNLVPGEMDANHTAYSGSGPEGWSGGFRGIAFANTSTMTNENQPIDTSISGGDSEGEYMYDRVGGHLSWGSPGNPGYPRFAALKAADTTDMDTITINWMTRGLVSQDLASGSDTYGQYITRDDTDFTEAGDGIYLFYWAGDKEGAAQYAGDLNASSKDHDGWRPVNVKPNGTTDSDYSPLLIPHKAEGYKGNRFFKNDLELPPWTRDKNTRFIIVQIDNHTGTHAARWGMSSVRFQRRVPKQVFAALDSPEAVSFMRVGTKEGDPKKRKKAVDNQLKASKEYVNKIVADPFPGTDAEIGEAQGTSGNKYVPQAWDNKKQEFADAGTLDQQKDKFVSKDVKLPPTYSEVQKAKKKK